MDYWLSLCIQANIPIATVNIDYSIYCANPLKMASEHPYERSLFRSPKQLHLFPGSCGSALGCLYILRHRAAVHRYVGTARRSIQSCHTTWGKKSPTSLFEKRCFVWTAHFQTALLKALLIPAHLASSKSRWQKPSIWGSFVTQMYIKETKEEIRQMFNLGLATCTELLHQWNLMVYSIDHCHFFKKIALLVKMVKYKRKEPTLSNSYTKKQQHLSILW